MIENQPFNPFDVTPRQLRAARAGLKLQAIEFHKLTGISRTALATYETDRDGPLMGRMDVFRVILGFYADQGVTFGHGETVSFAASQSGR